MCDLFFSAIKTRNKPRRVALGKLAVSRKLATTRVVLLLRRPILRYSREWWLTASWSRPGDVLSAKELNRAFTVAEGKLVTRKVPRQQLDPAQLAITAAARVG